MKPNQLTEGLWTFAAYLVGALTVAALYEGIAVGWAEWIGALVLLLLALRASSAAGR